MFTGTGRMTVKDLDEARKYFLDGVFNGIALNLTDECDLEAMSDCVDKVLLPIHGFRDLYGTRDFAYFMKMVAVEMRVNFPKEVAELDDYNITLDRGKLSNLAHCLRDIRYAIASHIHQKKLEYDWEGGKLNMFSSRFTMSGQDLKTTKGEVLSENDILHLYEWMDFVKEYGQCNVCEIPSMLEEQSEDLDRQTCRALFGRWVNKQRFEAEEDLCNFITRKGNKDG
jgi:hypothetical protein|tara:strand:+ start:1561 stop:2238 length:678 start_codon:yes stop_codon:yes gene_type:complete